MIWRAAPCVLGLALAAGVGGALRDGGSASAARSAAGGPVQVWLTTTSGPTLAKKLEPQPDLTFGEQVGTALNIDLHPAVTYQSVDGFGGAMTDSAASL